MNLEKVIKTAIKEAYDVGYDTETYSPERERNYEGFFDVSENPVKCEVCGWQGKVGELILDNDLSICPRCESGEIQYE